MGAPPMSLEDRALPRCQLPRLRPAWPMRDMHRAPLVPSEPLQEGQVPPEVRTSDLQVVGLV
eukprot:CAMPEP_0183450424 /NCGR_PEP_ID=MMETSP0370-20130417/112571_1 /TAXON_ID=268820 /ORGANISM="Peridinium aciculiferum, Strain PAER-2" /LENGTH=61 /DNA_ID=CAMNT_0025641575 /DNA_START=8 /DNA_END=193 /DNA_ORIENTATION=-